MRDRSTSSSSAAAPLGPEISRPAMQALPEIAVGGQERELKNRSIFVVLR